MAADVGGYDLYRYAVIARRLDQFLCRFGACISAGQDKVFRAVAHEPFGDTASQHSQTAGHEIGGVAAHLRRLCRQIVERLRDKSLDMALAAGGDGNLGLAIWMEQLRRQ